VYVQGKAVIKDGDPIRIEEFIDGAKADIDKMYGKLEELVSRIERMIAQLEDGTIVTDARIAKKIEEGYGFMASKRFENLANGAFVDVFFENPPDSNRKVNIVVIEVGAFGQGHLDVFKNNTKVAGGTIIEPQNLNLGSPNEAKALLEHGGNYVAGKKIHETVAFGGTKVRLVGSASEIGERLILPPSYNIIVRITNKAGTATDFSIEFKWFEDVLG